MSGRALHEYIDAVAEPTPAPGAGSVSAIAASLGCALGEMVCGITLNRAGGESDSRLHTAMETFSDCRQRLVALATDDESAYLAFRQAQALPRSTDEERQTRAIAMARTLERATDIPLATAQACAAALAALNVVATLSSRHALADVAAAAYLADAALRGALENVWVNLRLMKDEQVARVLRERADAALLRGSLSFDGVMGALASRSN